jgi:hypothetical protein
LCEKLFGVAIRNSEGKLVPVRYVGEQHVKEDLGHIPTAQDWLSQIKPQRWMYGQRTQEALTGDAAFPQDLETAEWISSRQLAGQPWRSCWRKIREELQGG